MGREAGGQREGQREGERVGEKETGREGEREVGSEKERGGGECGSQRERERKMGRKRTERGDSLVECISYSFKSVRCCHCIMGDAYESPL